jgi:hypothetical protein
MSAVIALPGQPTSEPKLSHDQLPVSKAENNSHVADVPNAPPSRGMQRITWLAVVLSLLASLFLFALDNTIVADVQPNIVYTLGEVEKLPWIASPRILFSMHQLSENPLYVV